MSLNTELEAWESVFINYFERNTFDDGSHDIHHFKRVWKTAQLILKSEEPCDVLLVLAGCYFHDCVHFEKNDPRRAEASTFAAKKAIEILTELQFPTEKLDELYHVIQAHSFSANILPETIEAKIVQDADRMEALGAIGIARCFYTAGRLNSQLFHTEDPMAKQRKLDDKTYALDHFEKKLLYLPETMQTASGKQLAHKRAYVISEFRKQLISEL